MSHAPTIPAALTIIEKRKNRAVDAALVEALPDLDPMAQAEALRIIAARGHQAALATLAARFNDYEPAIQLMLLDRIRISRAEFASRWTWSGSKLDVPRSSSSAGARIPTSPIC